MNTVCERVREECSPHSARTKDHRDQWQPAVVAVRVVHPPNACNTDAVAQKRELKAPAGRRAQERTTLSLTARNPNTTVARSNLNAFLMYGSTNVTNRNFFSSESSTEL